MIKKILKLIFMFFIIFIILGIGGYSFSSFKHYVELKNPKDVFDPFVDSIPNLDLPGLPDISVDTTITEQSTEDNTTEELPTELLPAEVDFPNENINKIEFSTTKNIKVTINGQSIELTSTTTASFIKWLSKNYNENANVKYEELEVIKDNKDKSNEEIVYNDFLKSEEELNILVDDIEVVESLPELDNYDRTTYEKPVQSYELNGESYNRNDYAWKTSEFLINEDPFEYICPYTGEIITDESDLDFDHLVPLKSTYLRGANEWTDDQRNEYAYDQFVGVDVLNSANRSKSDKGPTEWLPDENIEDYCYSWLLICSKYNLVMTNDEIDICLDYINTALENGETIQRLGIIQE